MSDTNNTALLSRLTALWAFSECALGGIMHALKLPFTGVLVGGFAVLCIALLAHFSGRSAGAVFRATLLVILVKAVVSPQSPPTAYIAVGFQGVIGALLLCYGRPFAWMPFIFGPLAMLESAFQKILVLLIFFGAPLVEALDKFWSDVLKNFNLEPAYSGSAMVVSVYIGIYAIWGVVLAFWMRVLPRQVLEKQAQYANWQPGAIDVELQVKKRKKGRWVFFFAILLFIVAVLLFSAGPAKGGQKAAYALLRTTAVLAAWWFIFRPLVQNLFQRWAARRQAEQQSAIADIVGQIPLMQTHALSLYAYVSAQQKGWRKWPEFVKALFVTTLRPPLEQETPQHEA